MKEEIDAHTYTNTHIVLENASMRLCGYGISHGLAETAVKIKLLHYLFCLFHILGFLNISCK